MLCKTCGAQIPDDALECEFCGAKTGNDVMTDETTVIDSAEVERQYAEDVAEGAAMAGGAEIFDENEKKRQEQMQKMMEDKKIQLSEIERRRNEKRQRQKRNKIMLITLICALAVAAAGIGVYYVAQNLNTTTTIETTPMPTVSATMAAVPSASPSVSPMPTAGATYAPYTEASGTNTNTSGTSNTQSWTSTGNSASSASTSNSSNKTSSGSSSSASTSGSSSSSASTSGSSSASTSNATNVANAVNSGISQDKINAQIAVGGEVIHNTGTGKYLMTFVTGGKKYYAHVSEGSTTEQIKNKTYTVTANPTGETYNGNTVYEITTLTNYEGDYVLPTSGTKLLTNADIKGMSKYDLALARNEIYARHGRKFQTAEYSKYFNGKSWYKLNPNYDYSDDNANLNEIETKNVNFLLEAERK